MIVEKMDYKIERSLRGESIKFGEAQALIDMRFKKYTLDIHALLTEKEKRCDTVRFINNVKLVLENIDEVAEICRVLGYDTKGVFVK